MKTKNSYFSKTLVILMAIMMVFTMMPSMAFAADPAGTIGSNEQTQTCPVTIKAGETAISAVATGETLSSVYNGSADIFEVAVAPETDKITVGDYQNGDILAYNYDAENNWLAGYYANGGSEGVAQAEVSVDANADNVADYIWVQTPYVTAEGQEWPTSRLICVIKLVYQLPVEVTIGGQTIATTDTFVKDGYTYKDASSNYKSDLYVLHAPAGTTEAVIQKKDKTNFLAYNYGKNGRIDGQYDATGGVSSATVKVDANNDGAADYILIQNLYNADQTGEELLCTLQFVVEGGLPKTTESIPALSDFEQQEAIKKAVKSLSGKTGYCDDSDWVTAFYANGGTLSTENSNTYLKKVYGDIVASAPLGTLAKDVIALTAMGYDPSNIGDTAGNSYNLLEQIYNSNIADLGAYGIYTAPYILLAYDAFNFELPKNASLSRDVLIKYIHKAQAADGSWGGYTSAGVSYPGTAGDTASVAQALLPYAATDASVKAAIEKANAFIEKNSENSKDSTNYLAYITLYEALQGKKASEIVVDEEAGTDVIDHLLSYKLKNDTFGFINTTTTSKSATVEAFKALTAYKNITDGVAATSGNIYNSQGRYWNGLQAVSGLPAINDTLSDIFITAPKKLSYKIGEKIDLTGLTVTAQTIGGTKKDISTGGITANPTEITSGTQLSYSGFDTTTAGTKTVTVKYEEFDNFVNKSIGKTAEFIITVSAADGSSSEKVNTVSIGVYDETGKSIVKDSAYVINAGKTSVMDVLKAVLGNAGKTYVLKASGTYIAEIDGLGEFDKGQNSGWMYKVDGKLPDIPANEYKLNGNEKIEWFYTKDWTTVPGTTGGGGGTTEEIKNVTSDTKAGTTTAPTEVKVNEKTNADGTKTKVADVKVSADNQKEILKQAKANKTKEIILNVSKSAVGDAGKADVTLDKSFIDSIVKDTDAKLTIKTPFGDKTYTQDELKAMSQAATGSTVTIAVEKAAEEPTDDTAANVAKAKSITADLKLAARSSKTAKKNIKAVLKSDAKVNASIKELKDLGFTVKYRFYRSTKKAASYKSAVTKKAAAYTNTSGKKGTKYFYKVQVRVYDENGKLVAKTALKQCKYASRTWSK